jgi:hypothetical protein
VDPRVSGVTDDRLQGVRGDAQAEPAADVGWECSDWSACLRRERRKQLAVAATLVLMFFVVSPLLRWTVLDPSFGWTYWTWVVITLIHVAEVVISFVSATDRARWERETRQTVRIRHALRHHTGIGVADRALVTERARAMVTVSKVAFVGWPLLGGLIIGTIIDVGLPASLVVPVVLLCLLLVGRAVRRARLARRWLADPLPRDEPADLSESGGAAP